MLDNKLNINKLDKGRNGIACEPQHRNTAAIKNGKPLLSIIIPVFQEEKILENSLKLFSPVIRERYSMELIVSDGGSTDRTLEIAEKYADKVIRHQSPARQTISQGRNRGAEAASGDILVFINADTKPAEPDKFFRMIAEMAGSGAALGGYSALACPVQCFPDEVVFKDKVFYAIHNSYVWFLNKIGLGMGRGECQIVCREVFREVGGYNDNIVAGEDFDLYRRIADRGRIRFAGDLLVLESPRRFRKYGYMRTIWSWTLNSLTVWFLGRSVSREWEAVR
ncbi:MAG: glycosyltransferase [Candidatus Kapaibacterium sp.]